jgi:ankyrin repeat protein
LSFVEQSSRQTLARQLTSCYYRIFFTALIRAFPASVSSQTKRGNTPLAEAAKYRLSYAAMELLIEEYPEALQQRNFKGERPLERAVAAGAKSSFVALLEKATEGGQLSLMAALRVDRAIRAPSHPGDVYRARRHR